MKKSLLLPALLCLAFQPMQAQTADEIIDKYYVNTGGIQKWKDLKSLKMEGDITMQMGTFPFTLYRKTPNKMKIVVSVMGQELIPQAFDGETAWMVNPFSGASSPEKLSEAQAKAIRDQASMEDPFIDYMAKGYEASYAGTADVSGTPCQVVKLVKNKGVAGMEETSSYYFDAATGMQMMIKQISAENGGQEVEIYLSDYQDTGNGLVMPFVMDTRSQGQSIQKITFKKMGVNEEIADEFFAFPAAPAPTN